LNARVYVSSNKTSINWKIGAFFRSQIWDHGIVGDRKIQPEQRIFSDNELAECLEELRKYASSDDIKSEIIDMPDMSSYLFGWRDLSGEDVVKQWVDVFLDSNEVFLDFLLKLRHIAVSDRIFYPLSKDTVSCFMNWDSAYDRVNSLLASNLSEKAGEVIGAIRQDRNFSRE